MSTLEIIYTRGNKRKEHKSRLPQIPIFLLKHSIQDPHDYSQDPVSPRQLLSCGKHVRGGSWDPDAHSPLEELSAAHIGLIGSIGESCV